MDIVRLDGVDHVIHQRLAADIHTAHSADVAQGLQNVGDGAGVHSTQEANNTNDALELDALEALLQGAGASNLNDVVNPDVVARQTARDLAPIGLGFVVNNVVGTEVLKALALLFGRGCCDHSCARCFCELYFVNTCPFGHGRIARTYLQSKDTHTASALHQDGLARKKRLQPIQRIPAC